MVGHTIRSKDRPHTGRILKTGVCFTLRILFFALLGHFGREGAAPLAADFCVFALGDAVIAVIPGEFEVAIAATAGGFAGAADGRLEVALDLSYVSHVVTAYTPAPHTKCCYVLRVVNAGGVGGRERCRPRTRLAHEIAGALDRSDGARFFFSLG